MGCWKQKGVGGGVWFSFRYITNELGCERKMCGCLGSEVFETPHTVSTSHTSHTSPQLSKVGIKFYSPKSLLSWCQYAGIFMVTVGYGPIHHSYSSLILLLLRIIKLKLIHTHILFIMHMHSNFPFSSIYYMA